jgi:hypothetical protein
MRKSIPGEPRIESGYRVANYRELKKDDLPRYLEGELRLCSNVTLVAVFMLMMLIAASTLTVYTKYY